MRSTMARGLHFGLGEIDERHRALAAQCEKWLTGAKSRLDAALAAKQSSNKDA